MTQASAAAFMLLVLSSGAIADSKLTNRLTIGEQNFDSTAFMKGGKIRSEVSFAPGISSVTIQDCANQRVIQLNDRAGKYMLAERGDSAQQSSSQSASAPTVTVNVSQQDTSERRQFFGYTARHIKGTITAEGSGSCRANLEATTDGWYIDLAEAQGCSTAEPEIVRSQLHDDACSDRRVVKTSGLEKIGYPVLLDLTIKERERVITFHQETTSLSTASLDSALFEIPAGYRQVESYRDLIGSPINSSAMASSQQSASASRRTTDDASTTAAEARLKLAGQESKRALRIGVMQIGSSVAPSFSTEGLQQELANDINFLGGQAVLIATDPHDRETALEQAKQQGCDYVVFTTINNLRTASVGQRLGSILGRGGLGGAGGSGQGRVELNAEVKVFVPENATPIFDGDVNFRQNDSDATAKGLMKTEARNVMLEIRKLQTSK